MKILLVANYGPDRQNSMARYAQLLHAELSRRGHAVVEIRPAPIATTLVSQRNPLFHWLGYLDKFVLFPPLLSIRSRSADIVHVCDHSNSFYLRWTGNTPSLITGHDALAIRSALGHFSQNPTRWSGVRLQHWILRGLARARRIVCVSEKTREDFTALLPSEILMDVVPDPLSSDFKPASPSQIAAIREAWGIPAQDEYLLHVGKEGWYKNRKGVLRITQELRKFPRFERVKLVMAGSPLPPELREIAREISGVVECAGPSDEDLTALYTGALALLFPSLEEGFGWPIAEAQACGCPVITSARPPMTEIAGDGAILIDPEDPVSASAEIAVRIQEAGALRLAGFANVKRYSANAVIDRYLDIYSEMITGSTQRGKKSLV